MVRFEEFTVNVKQLVHTGSDVKQIEAPLHRGSSYLSTGPDADATHHEDHLLHLWYGSVCSRCCAGVSRSSFFSSRRGPDRRERDHQFGGEHEHCRSETMLPCRGLPERSQPLDAMKPLVDVSLINKPTVLGLDHAPWSAPWCHSDFVPIVPIVRYGTVRTRVQPHKNNNYHRVMVYYQTANFF